MDKHEDEKGVVYEDGHFEIFIEYLYPFLH